MKEYLGNDYEAVFAVHDNTEHPHSHIVFNSVSFRDGKKYHYQKGDWEKYIQPITNRLCKEYGLSTIELDEESGKRRGMDSYQEWNSYRDGNFVWSRIVARDVDACIIQAASFESFVSMLENKGYEVKNANGERKYLAVKPQGMKRFVRLKSLGEEYTEERIRQRIYEENISSYIKENKPRIVYCRVRRYKRAKMSGLQKKYYARLYRIGKLKKKAYSVAWKYRDEIKKMQKLQAQYQFLVRHDIHSVVDLALVEDNLTDKRKEASAIIIIIICGFFMIYTVYFRFLRLLIIVPMGSIAFSTMGGNRTVNHTVAAYCKYFLSVTFEAVTMALAIIVCNAFINAGLPTFTADYADWAKTLIYLCEMTFTIALTVGSVKGAQSLTSKAFGL